MEIKNKQNPPQRIISLVPSLTELLFDLGLDQEVVGITKFCVRPTTWFRTKTRVGGTKDFKLDRIRALSPSLIIANKEENDRTLIEALQVDYPILLTDIKTVNDAIAAIQLIGESTGKQEQAQFIINQIAVLRNDAAPKYSAAYLIWRKPYMVAGSDTYISSMLQEAGFSNACEEMSRYPIITETDLTTLKADVFLLSSEPFPFQDKHINELAQICPNKHIILVDGEMFSWYGSRMLQAYGYFCTLQQKLDSKQA